LRRLPPRRAAPRVRHRRVQQPAREPAPLEELDARSLTQAGLVLDERAARGFAEGCQQIMAARQQIAQR